MDPVLSVSYAAIAGFFETAEGNYRNAVYVSCSCSYRRESGCGRSAILRKASYVYQEKALDEYLYVCTGYPKCSAMPPCTGFPQTMWQHRFRGHHKSFAKTYRLATEKVFRLKEKPTLYWRASARMYG